MEMNVNLWSESAGFPLLTTLTLVPLATMASILYARSSSTAWRFGFTGALLTMALCLYLLVVFDAHKPGIHLAEHFYFGFMSYRVGVDGTNILFIPLTAVITLLALVYTRITRHVTDRLFIASLMAYEGILIGAFSALNAMQFWMWCLLELIPVAFLSLHAGTGQNRRRIVALFIQYWGCGLLMSLSGFLLLGFGSMEPGQALNFDWLALKQNNQALNYEKLIFILLFYGFAIRMPLFPFHGWLPILVEQGTVASCAVFLVGLKLGIYAVIRFILPLIPGMAEQWADFVVTLGLFGIFYGALMALMQINIRRLLAFAVISHTGMLVIGIFAFNDYGLEGSILLCLAYGLATAGMFFSVGLIYERTRTAFIPRLGGLFDTNSTIALLFLICALSTMVMPGTPGFDAAHLLIEGTIEERGWLIAIAILIGNVLAAAFLLWAFQRIFMAMPKRSGQPHSTAHHPVVKERIITVVICLLLIGTGFYTTPWLKYIDQDAAEIGEHYPVHGPRHDNSLKNEPEETADSEEETND
ncbi:MAG: complex I subunit 4 family protein [Gammaproteobacteria bacterium]